ncbi:type I-U CRISPR-associated helicase/endonuclease Cas3 [Streptomyces sp. TRM66268-LWL]|uniref:Type I-U CRISPR-associated helicase/endonuclease Cas3 n=1 Tax=Streptomyces polyasparticus TaxID=2767826 RepID=A0ABR7SMV6_9ACTN|nr:type I-U CRISPR-associated helicase/endonuclease Cas3 [Streptomyces polyasparticus]MBC9715703.1 type I-U CRISPR-associated helicase/endonuclease Cas3 [Streptomyces polyasparticus]
MTLALKDFPDFVEAVHGHRPFPWQTAYLNQAAAEDCWPDLDIPTGLGKTSLIDIWLFLLAWQAANGRERTVPLRLFFVVDRRLVVDQAHEHARTVQHALDTAPADSVAGRVAQALRALSGEATALEAVRMRGGVDWASRWLRSPAQPAVITSTVDQYGSRLLFRGYHTSPRMRPIDAALCGMDALLAVDEAHIALPLLTTAIDCSAYQRTASHRQFAHRGVQVVSLTATACADPSRPRHSISEADRQHPVAGRRLNAQRRLTLWDARPLGKDATASFAQAAEQAVDTMLPLVARPVIGVVANTIRNARALFQRLSHRTDMDVLLLTGRSRATDRDRLLDSGLMRELFSGVSPDRERPLVVVATQTVEVGVDLSFAGLVSENAACAALVQRLGRLDRTGAFDWAPAIVIRAGVQEPQDIPVYGEAAHATWQWLAEHTPVVDAGTVGAADVRGGLEQGLLVNPTTLPALLHGADIRALNMPAPRIPVLHQTLLDSWTRTSPAPVPDQPAAPFLHGINTAPEDVQVLWRGDLPLREGNPDWDEWAARMAQVPPHPGETVAIPAAQLRRYLTQPTAADATSDLEGAPLDNTVPAKQKRPSMAPVLRLDMQDNQWVPATEPHDIRPGSTIVLPAEYSGHDAYGWTGAPGNPVVDLGDFPPRTTDSAPTRLEAQLLALLGGFDEETLRATEAVITSATARLQAGKDDETPTDIVSQLLARLLHLLPLPPSGDREIGQYTDLLRQRLTTLQSVTTWDITPNGRSSQTGHAIWDASQPARLILVPARPEPTRAERTAGVGDDSADGSSLTRPVPLAQHSKAVAARAADFAQRLGLPADLVAAVDTGAYAHDCGKHHPRFQCMLCAGDRLLAESLDEPLAKSGMDPSDHTGRRRAAHMANWEPELRHEALSSAAVQQWLATNPEHTRGLDKDLIVHLVASHHGHARPLLPPVTDPDPIDVTCTMPDQQTVTVNSAAMGTDWTGPDRFHTLNRHYGPWGLALLEAVVRLADMACSEEGS